MITEKRWGTTLLIIGSVFVGALTLPFETLAQENTSPLKSGGIQWTRKMQDLYKTLADLLTDVTSEKRFLDPANRNRIQDEADKLASFVHDLDKKKVTSLDPDPTIPLIAHLLARETKDAAAQFKRGNLAYARHIFRSLPGYCITCHTRNASGSQFAKLPFEPTSNTLTPVERGEFFAASRQFDRAQSEFISVIQDPVAAGSYSLGWERAVHQALNIAVRVRQDPVQAQGIIQAILNQKEAPSSVKEDASIWLKSVYEWKDEGPRQFNTEEGLHAEAIRLLAKAREIQKYPVDRTADILYLRASAAAHDLLQNYPHGKYAQDGLFLEGLSYEVLSPLKTDDLHELFYEACIRMSPHTNTADLCYRRYEQSVLLGYTGTIGTELPPDERGKLLDLKLLSRPSRELSH